ncbi:MAG: T9SS type A sorting domain-containing protein [Candidatus Kapabacteria bacterium]|nr:T9SS type A sorting domain-containing protein [Candidatus Kapabacteria bacterium]
MKTSKNSKISKSSRRDFLKLMLTASVFSASYPHILLGKEEGDILEKKDKILGYFHIELDKYPQLYEVWGSVRLAVEGIDPREHYPKIFITKVPYDEFGKEYVSVSEACSHEGNPLEDLNLETHLFECVKGHGSLFLADGKPFWGEALRIRRPLVSYKVNYFGGNVLNVEIDALITDYYKEAETLSYLRQNLPNPCSDSAIIEFGVEKPANVKILIYSIKGKLLFELYNNFTSEGNHSISVDMTSLPSGVYLYKMFINNEPIHTKKLTKI